MTKSFSIIARTAMAVIIAVLLAAPQTVISNSGLPQADSPRQRGGDNPPADSAAGSMPPGSSGQTDQIIMRLSAVGARMTSASGNAASSQVMQPALLAAMQQAAGISLAQARYLGDDTYVLKLPEKVNIQDAWTTGKRMEALAEVLYAEPDLPVHAMGITPDDPYYPLQWHYFKPTTSIYGINAPDAWGITQGKSSVTVAVIDSGIHTHSEFNGRLVQGYDFVDLDPNPNVDSCANADAWHGTHVAGTIGANSNNGTGVAGINWFAKIQPVRVLDCTGNGDGAAIIAGMKWAAGIPIADAIANPSPAKVLNLSLGGPTSYNICPTWMQDAINEVVNKGVTVVVAAGNDAIPAEYFFPANCQKVITVAATAKNGGYASYSNWGNLVDISAPGGDTSGDIFSTYGSPDYYANARGTSMAAPHVTGVISLMLGLNAALTPTAIEQVLKDNVTAFPIVINNQCITSECGDGILNADKAVRAVTVTDKYAVLPNILNDPSFEGAIAVSSVPISAFAVSPWIGTSTNVRGTPLCNNTSCGIEWSRTGSIWSRFGPAASSTETSSITQQLVIPARSVGLGFFLWVEPGTVNPWTSDNFTVKVDGVEVFRIDNRTDALNYPYYTFVELDISQFGDGQSHTIGFYGSLSSNDAVFHVDDVYVVSYYPTYLPQVMR